jgi:hypothetical protein
MQNLNVRLQIHQVGHSVAVQAEFWQNSQALILSELPYACSSSLFEQSYGIIFMKFLRPGQLPENGGFDGFLNLLPKWCGCIGRNELSGLKRLI